MKQLNLHCHTNYSDGRSTIRQYAQAYKRLGYPLLCITDHDYMMSKEKYQEQLTEAQMVSEEEAFPIICGLEVSLGYEEGLLFNTSRCKAWFDAKENIHHHLLTDKDSKPLKDWLSNYDSSSYALVLCHPSCGNYFHEMIPELYSVFDAYEIGNCGSFWNEESCRFLKKTMPDAATVMGIDCHNVSFLDDELLNKTVNWIEDDIVITNENELIKWIKGLKR